MARKKYKRRRRRSGGFILSLLTFCIVVAATVMSVTVFLKVNVIDVSGVTRYDSKKIITTSGIQIGDNMFMINKFDVAERILSEYPYIEQIKIRRHLPDTLSFEITEREPAAYVVSEGSRWLIDRHGYILERIKDVDTVNVPKVTGVEVVTPYIGAEVTIKNADQPPVLREVLSALLATDICADIKRVDIEKLYDINLVYGDRFLVSLGDMTELTQKIEMLRAVLGELSEFDKGTINLSAVREARFKPNAKIDLTEKTSTSEKKEVSEPEISEDEENVPEIQEE